MNRVAAWGPIVLLSVVIAACWAWNPVAWIADDSYFYLVIARNLAERGVPTFSGILPTNGAHPLWMWGLGAWATAVHAVAPAALLAPGFGVAAAAVTMGLAAWANARLLRTMGAPVEAVAVPLAFTGFFGVLASECHACWLGLSLLGWQALRTMRAPDTRNQLILGAAAAFAVLARLDNVFAAGAVLAAVGMRLRSARLVPLAVLVATLAAYVATNAVFFGGLMPVSGWMKSAFPTPGWRGFQGGSNPSLSGVSILWSLVPMGLAVPAVRASAGPKRAILAAFLVGLAAENVYVGLFTRSHTGWYWYGTLGVFVLGLSLPILASHPGVSGAFRVATRGLAVATAAAMAWKAATWRLPEDSAPARSLALVRADTRPGDTVLVSDWPGYVAFYAPDRHIFAADLLTSNRRWYEAMRAGGDALDFVRATCAEAGAPLTHILWSGNRWLVVSPDDTAITYNDPRRYPEESAIGRWPLPPELDRSGEARIWRVGAPE